MSDAGKKKKKIKLRLGGTPSVSRAGSPDVRNGTTGSRAGSPQASGKISLFLGSYAYLFSVASMEQDTIKILTIRLPLTTRDQGLTLYLAPLAPRVGPIQPSEIAADIPDEGISISQLMKRFGGRVGEEPGKTKKGEFIALVKECALLGKDKLLRRK